MSPKRRFPVIACGVAATLMLLGRCTVEYPRLLYNASPSTPRGWYWTRRSGEPGPGDLVVARVPRSVAELAAERRYLPLHVPVLKRVAAVGGDWVCASNTRVYIRGAELLLRHQTDARGRALPAWSDCRTLAKDELFLTGDIGSASFDSRYFGPVDRSQVLGRAIALWTFR